MPAGNSGDALRALAQEALERGVHPDRESALQDFVGEDDSTEPGTPDEGGQGPGGEGGKPRDTKQTPEQGSTASTTVPGDSGGTGKAKGK